MEEKNNEIKAQSIIDAIQRYEIGEEGFLDKDVDEAVKKADSFLLDNGEEPCFFEDFVSKTITDLKTTINGCIKSRNNPKKKDDLKKYKEGYFNEIIQNANDVVWKTGSENPTVEMSFFKVGNKYTVRCVYPDKGFSLENIYGFCTRGNSDKKSQNGQEGMYGIGIKSLFCFVNEFEINSNINIKVSSSGEKKLDKVELNFAKDKRIVDGKTILSFSFIYNETGNNHHAGFNVVKLAQFIDKIYEDNKNYNEIIRNYFLTGKDEEIIFDARALFFTELRGDNRHFQNSIKKVIIKKDVTEICKLESREEEVKIETEIDNVIVKKVSIIDQEKYLLMHYKDKQISIGFRINSGEDDIDKERLYSTYFIGTYENPSPILGVQTGCLINTTEINSSRSGLERENEGEPKVLREIMYKGKAGVSILCELAVKDEEALEVLCRLLYLYRCESELDKDELSPKYIFNGSLEELQNSVAKWTFKERFKFILKDEDGIDHENRLINKNRPPNADLDNVSRLFDIYIKYIKKEEGESDIIVRYKGLFEDLGIGIKKLCDALFEENNDILWIRQIAGLSFLSGIKEVIINRIGGTGLNEIQEYLSKIDENDRIFIKQLIARYKVTDCFDYMGRYSASSVKDWLFDNKNYSETDWKNKVKEYEDSYGNLKRILNSKIYTVAYYRSPHPMASSDLWYTSNDFPYSRNSFSDVNIYENDIISLLKLIHDEILFIGLIEKKPIITDFGWNEILRNRDRRTTGWDGDIKFFYLDILNVAFTTFKGFVAARNYIDRYNETAKNEDFKINYINQCKIKTVKIPDLRSIFNWLATYEVNNICNKYNMLIFDSVELDKDLESDSELIRFIKQFIGRDFYVKVESISVNNKNCKFIGYILSDGDNKGIYIKQAAKNGVFTQVGRIGSEYNEKCLLVFYSNCDEQSSLSEVLANIGYGDDICEYIKNFIKTGNIRNLSSEMYNRYLKKKRLEYEYPFEFDEIEKASICENLSIEDTYSILSAKMSYDGHCPICNQIPTLNIKLHETNINRLERRNSMIAMLVAKYREKDIYIKILCCKNCFEEYKNSLSEARVKDVDGELYKKLVLKSRISTTNRTHDLVNEVKLSPDNWDIICKFNRL